MSVVNLTKNSRRTSTRRQATNQRQAAPAPAQFQDSQVCRKVKGKWIKGDVKPKPKICLQFQKHGACSFGDRCRFEHVAKKAYRRSNNRKQEPTTKTQRSFIARNRFVFDESNGPAW